MWEFIALISFIIFIESKKVWMKLSSWTLDCSIRFCWSQSVLWIIPLLKEIAQWSAENLFCFIAKILNRSFGWFKMAPNSAFKPRMTHNFYETKKKYQLTTVDWGKTQYHSWLQKEFMIPMNEKLQGPMVKFFLYSSSSLRIPSAKN